MDVSQPDEWEALATWIRDEHGRVDGLVNNAGIASRGLVDTVTAEDWNHTIGVNLTGPMVGIQSMSALMDRGGSIVNVSSIAGLTGHLFIAYTASKWGVRGLSRVASTELGPRGIRVNTIFPGYIETPMSSGAPAAFRDVAVSDIPLGRVGEVGDVAPLVVFLMSDAASWITGAEIPVDGGEWAHGGQKLVNDEFRPLFSG